MQDGYEVVVEKSQMKIETSFFTWWRWWLLNVEEEDIGDWNFKKLQKKVIFEEHEGKCRRWSWKKETERKDSEVLLWFFFLNDSRMKLIMRGEERENFPMFFSYDSSGSFKNELNQGEFLFSVRLIESQLWLFVILLIARSYDSWHSWISVMGLSFC